MSTYHIIRTLFEFLMIITITVMIYEQDRLNNALVALLDKLKNKDKPIVFNGRDFFEIEEDEK